MENTRFADLRDELDMTKKEVAKNLDVSPSAYGRWENGKVSIPTERMYQMSNFYRVNLDYLLSLIDMRLELVSDDEINMDLVSTRVREIRQDFGETLRVFSRRLNTSNSTWSAYETGKVLILGDFLVEICKRYNYSADWILGRSEEKYRDDL